MLKQRSQPPLSIHNSSNVERIIIRISKMLSKFFGHRHRRRNILVVTFSSVQFQVLNFLIYLLIYISASLSDSSAQEILDNSDNYFNNNYYNTNVHNRSRTTSRESRQPQSAISLSENNRNRNGTSAAAVQFQQRPVQISNQKSSAVPVPVPVPANINNNDGSGDIKELNPSLNAFYKSQSEIPSQIRNKDNNHNVSQNTNFNFHPNPTNSDQHQNLTSQHYNYNYNHQNFEPQPTFNAYSQYINPDQNYDPPSPSTSQQIGNYDLNQNFNHNYEQNQIFTPEQRRDILTPISSFFQKLLHRLKYPNQNTNNNNNNANANIYPDPEQINHGNYFPSEGGGPFYANNNNQQRQQQQQQQFTVRLPPSQSQQYGHGGVYNGNGNGANLNQNSGGYSTLPRQPGPQYGYGYPNTGADVIDFTTNIPPTSHHNFNSNQSPNGSDGGKNQLHPAQEGGGGGDGPTNPTYGVPPNVSPEKSAGETMTTSSPVPVAGTGQYGQPGGPLPGNITEFNDPRPTPGVEIFEQVDSEGVFLEHPEAPPPNVTPERGFVTSTTPAPPEMTNSDEHPTTTDGGGMLEEITDEWDIRNSVPGQPLTDYPVLFHIPKTNFSCEGRVSGFYADPQTRCQVFHRCTDCNDQPNVLKESFLCPNGTQFNQQILNCDWWTNVDCPKSENYFAINEELGAKKNGNYVQLSAGRRAPNPKKEVAHIIPPYNRQPLPPELRSHHHHHSNERDTDSDDKEEEDGEDDIIDPSDPQYFNRNYPNVNIKPIAGTGTGTGPSPGSEVLKPRPKPNSRPTVNPTIYQRRTTSLPAPATFPAYDKNPPVSFQPARPRRPKPSVPLRPGPITTTTAPGKSSVAPKVLVTPGYSDYFYDETGTTYPAPNDSDPNSVPTTRNFTFTARRRRPMSIRRTNKNNQTQPRNINSANRNATNSQIKSNYAYDPEPNYDFNDDVTDSDDINIVPPRISSTIARLSSVSPNAQVNNRSQSPSPSPSRSRTRSRNNNAANSKEKKIIGYVVRRRRPSAKRHGHGQARTQFY